MIENIEIEHRLLLKEASSNSFLGLKSLKINQGYFNLKKVKVEIDEDKRLVIKSDKEIKKITLSDNAYSRILKMFVVDKNNTLSLSGENLSMRIRETIEGSVNSTYEITIKSKKSLMERYEEDIEIEKKDSVLLFEITKNSTINKERLIKPLENGLKAEIDIFKGRNNGMIIVEIEVSTINTPIPKLDESWVYVDVSTNPDFSNASLAFIPHRLMGDGRYNSDHSCTLLN